MKLQFLAIFVSLILWSPMSAMSEPRQDRPHSEHKNNNHGRSDDHRHDHRKRGKKPRGDQAVPTLRVIDFKLVSTTPVDRSVHELEFSVQVRNGSSEPRNNVTVAFESDAESATVLDGNSIFSALNAGSSTFSPDTIKIRVDRRRRFDPHSLKYTFDDDSLLGLDLNDDGLRDDLEAFLDRKFGTASDQVVDNLTEIALESTDIINLGPDSPGVEDSIQAVVQNAGTALVCLSKALGPADATVAYKELFIAIYNTPDRLAEFVEFESLSNGLSFEYAPEMVADRCPSEP